MDEFVDQLLTEPIVLGIALPHLLTRLKMEEQGLLEPRVSQLQINYPDEFERMLKSALAKTNAAESQPSTIPPKTASEKEPEAKVESKSRKRSRSPHRRETRTRRRSRSADHGRYRRSSSRSPRGSERSRSRSRERFVKSNISLCCIMQLFLIALHGSLDVAAEAEIEMMIGGSIASLRQRRRLLTDLV
jgi:hypothetical protein